MITMTASSSIGVKPRCCAGCLLFFMEISGVDAAGVEQVNRENCWRSGHFAISFIVKPACYGLIANIGRKST